MEMGLTSLVVEPDNNARIRIKTAIQAVPMFTKCQTSANFQEAQSRLDSDPYDVIFLSHHLPKEKVHDFVTTAKQKQNSEASALILVLPAQASGDIIKDLLTGADGMLVEPYSVDQLTEITRIAQKVKKENQERKEKLAVKMLVKDLTFFMDLAARAKGLNVDPVMAIRALRKLGSAINTFNDAKRAFFHEEFFTLATDKDASAKRQIVPKSPSARIRKIYEEKVKSELQRIAS
jgi:response regulator of citrate/malate metabolism